MSALRPVVDTARVVVCCGAGGVGKTTIAAGIGLAAAAHGRRAVVVTIDPARRLADALGLPGGLTGEPQRLALDGERSGELWATMLDTPAMFERVIRQHATSAEQADRIVANRFYRNLAVALGGTQEYMATEALHMLDGDDRFDVVVVDTPPSRNALDFLEAPGVLTRFLDHPVFKLMMAPTRTGMRVLSIATQPLLRAIGRVVGSDALTDAVAFFQAFAGMEAGFRQRAEAVTAILRDDATAFVLVAAPQRESVREAIWFADQLAGRDLRIAAAVVNRAHPRFGDGTAAEATERAAAARANGGSDAAALWDNLAELREIAHGERAEIAALADRISWDRIVTVPLLPSDVHDVSVLTTLAGKLVGEGDGGAR